MIFELTGSLIQDFNQPGRFITKQETAFTQKNTTQRSIQLIQLLNMPVYPVQHCRRRKRGICILKAINHTFQGHAILILVHQNLSNHIQINVIAWKNISKRAQGISCIRRFVVIGNSTGLIYHTQQLKNMFGNTPIQLIKNPMTNVNAAVGGLLPSKSSLSFFKSFSHSHVVERIKTTRTYISNCTCLLFLTINYIS